MSLSYEGASTVFGCAQGHIRRVQGRYSDWLQVSPDKDEANVRDREKKVEPIDVTEENFGDLVIESLKEHVDIKEGREEPAVIRTYPNPRADEVDGSKD